MKKLKCYVVDDAQESIDLTTRYVLRTMDLELVGTETNALVALSRIKNKEIEVDVVFLDLMMPGMDGIDFARQIIGLARVIFITADDSRAFEAFKSDGIDYLLKPLLEKDFLEAVSKVVKWFIGKESHEKLIFQVRKKSEFISIDPRELEFAESNRNYIILNLTSGIIHSTYSSMAALEARLAGLWFRRVHKAFLVNLEHIQTISKGVIITTNGNRIPIGPNYKEVFMKEINLKRFQS